ncbi:MAG: DNA-processing protein DprA [Bacteroidaceae bacterium]|nr:DNA-processing protein DprA [Bacteroidaceae bacterium]
MNTQEIIHTIALTQLNGLSLLNARILYDTVGSASEVYAHRKDILSLIPDASKRLVGAFAQMDNAVQRAEKEMEFVEKKGVKVLTLHDDDYPQRLKECEDAPLLLYYFGTADLNSSHIINIVGTRKCSEYGRELCNAFVADLKRCCPDVVIVSGLAYGIDICAHRAALNNGMVTLGVLAHGLDMIYPSMHRSVAAEMVHQGGGLLTEYVSHTTPEKMNFVRRNRIVAGLCDACIVVESLEKGGSLITAELSNTYNREVFAFPGRVYDEQSAGCNRLIYQRQATLLTRAEDLLETMGWQSSLPVTKNPQAIQPDLFPDLNEEESAIVNVLKKAEDKHINQISVETNIPFSRASMILLDLEMKGIVRALGGARYRIIHHV